MAAGDIITTKGAPADCAYMLTLGKVLYEPSPGQQFEFKGTNMIIGAAELVIEKDEKKPQIRHMTITEGEFCKYTKIAKSVLLAKISSYNIGFNIAKNIASNLVKLHKVVNDKNNQLSQMEKLARDYCRVFASTVFRLESCIEEYDATFLVNSVNDFKDTLTFNYGQSLIDQSASAKYKTDDETMNKFKRTYSAGSVIINEGDEANEMYILSEGTIGVYIHGKQIDTIKEKGQIIGEMGFILNEKRTATLSAEDETSLIVVDKPRIKGFFESNTGVFLQMVTTLAKREHYLCGLINEIDELINEAQPALDLESQQVDNYKKDLLQLREKISDYNTQRRMEWLTEVHKNLEAELKKLGLIP